MLARRAQLWTWRAVCFALMIFWWPVSTLAGEPPGQPLLRLETGMHTAQIRRIATDAQGRWAVTISYDKTARIWDVGTGEALGVLRPPISEGAEGQLQAVAVSPDGSRVAVAGYTGWSWDKKISIYIFDRQTLTLVRRIDQLPEVVLHMAFSPNGAWLAVGLAEGRGFGILDVSTGALIDVDDKYEDSCYGFDFDASGAQLVTASHDGKIRIYSVLNGRLRLEQVAPASDGSRPHSVRFSPDGRWIAVAYYDEQRVAIYDRADLDRVEYLMPGREGGGALWRVAWANDGSGVLAAGTWSEKPGIRSIVGWSSNGWKYIGSLQVSSNSVTDLIALPSGGFLYSSGDPGWGVLSNSGEILLERLGRTVDMRGAGGLLQAAKNGAFVRFGGLLWNDAGNVIDAAEFYFDVESRNLQEKGNGPTLMSPMKKSSRGNVVVDESKNKLSIDGKDIELGRHEVPRAFAISSEGDLVAVGTEWRVRLFDAHGGQVWSRSTSDIVWSVMLSEDGRWLIAAIADGTIRWYRVGSAERHYEDGGIEVLAYFPHPNRQDWVLWSPEGFYAASPGAADLIGYHVNRGKSHEGEFISLTQLADKLYRPGLVSARLGPDGDRLMDEAVKELGTVDDLLAYARNVPPEVRLEAQAGPLQGDTEVTFTATLVDRGGGIGPVKILVNGQPVEGRQSGVTEGRTVTRTFTLRLAPGQHSVQLAGTSMAGVAGQPTAPITALLKGAPGSTLHILAVGVENYQDAKLRLAHSGRDAEDLAADIARRAQPLFKRVATPHVLKDRQASLAGIEAAFATLRQEMQPQDTLVIFLAGHGETRNDAYTFLPWDFQRGAPGGAGEGLNEKRLFDMLRQSPARTLLLLDTCEAGSLVDMLAAADRINRLQQRAVIGASRRGELAQAGYNGHGVFTAAVLQVLGKSDNGEELTVMELYPQVQRTVDRISQTMGGAYRQSVQGFVGQVPFALVRR
jgi:WD40 repeat protein